MLEKNDFLNRLTRLKEYSDTEGRALTQEEVMKYFEGTDLSEEQTVMVLDYIQTRRDEMPELTEAEQIYLEEYRKTIPPEGTGPYLESYLATVARVATEYAGRGVSLEDLIQEGNIGLMAAMEALPEDVAPEEEKRLIEGGIRKTLSAMLEEQEQLQVTDEKVVGQVKDLINKIKALTEELGYKPSIDEVSHFLDMKVEEIKRLLILAGEEVEEDEPEEEESDELAAETVHHHHEHHHEHGDDCDCGHEHQHH